MPASLNIESNRRIEVALIYYLSNKLSLPFKSIPTKYLGFCSSLFRPDFAEEIYNKDLPELIKSHINQKDYLDSVFETGRKTVENIDLYGCIDWYSWCCETWGTKWNACETMRDGNTIYFQTAWSVADGIIEKLAQICSKYNISFTGLFADEDAGSNSGAFSSANGITYFKTCSNEAKETYIELWNYDPWSEEEEEY